MKLADKLKNYFLLFPALLSTSCASYKVPTSRYLPKEPGQNYEVRREALENSLYNFVPRHKEQIKWYDAGHWVTWALLGNESDGIFGEDCAEKVYSTNINARTFAKWTLRNPGHNLTSHVIGSAGWKRHSGFSLFDIGDKDFRLMGKGRDEVFNGDTYGLKFEFNDFKPFLSGHFPVARRREFQIYFGWRPEGKFGIKFRPVARKNKN